MLNELKATVELVSKCRICGSTDLIQRLDLGATPIAYRLLSETQLHEPEPYYPLSVAQCRECGLAQLEQKVNPRLLYPPDYPYDMNTTESAVSHFHEFAAEAAEKAGLEEDDLAIDIGSSTGVLLQGFEKFGATVLGVEPATKMAERAKSKGIDTISDFFDTELARKIRNQYGAAKVITATNVINQIDELQDLIEAVDILLGDGGLFVFETPHLLNTIEDLHYDHVYHEHSTYFSIAPIKPLVRQQDLCVADIETIEFRGGSLRCSIGRQDDYGWTSTFDSLLETEYEAGIYEDGTWDRFADRVKTHREKLNHLVYSIKQQDKTIAAVSVTAKGNSMLNYCGFTKDDFEFATEVMDTKLGKFTPGGRIPIVHDDELLEEMPDYALIMAWNFADAIMSNLSEYSDRGGKFIIPMPEPTVVEDE